MDNTKKRLRVFLCHSSSDKPVVEKFYDMLTGDGLDAWLDKKNLLPGQNWQIEIPKAVQSSDVVIVFLSAQSVTKEGYVQKEIKIALDAADEKPDGTIFIIPAKLENCKVPDRLGKFQWVDLFESDGYERLFKSLKIRAESLGIKIKATKQKQSVVNKASIGDEQKVTDCPIYIPHGLEIVKRKVEIMGFRNIKEYSNLSANWGGVVIFTITNSADEKTFIEFIERTKPDPLKTAFVLFIQNYYRVSELTTNVFDNLQIANIPSVVTTVTWVAAHSVSK